MSIAIPLFFLCLVFISSWFAKSRKQASSLQQTFFFIPKSLNWFLVALAAGTSANSGFIVTSAVAMGFGMGIKSLLFPLSFFLGDLCYWQFFAPKVNAYASQTDSRTIPEFITSRISGNIKPLKILISLCIIFSTILYTIAQWNASGKMFSGFYDFDPTLCILLFSSLILAYCLVGGFISSVYVDIVQGIFMMLLATITVVFCMVKIPSLQEEISAQFRDFQSAFIFFSENGIVYILGWACASIGFSFSQPHILDKVIAAKDQQSVKKARYVYMFFVQYTWMGMTFLGVLIKILYPDFEIGEHEKILPAFISMNSNEMLKGFVIAGVFATIASTGASLMISISNYLNADIFAENSFLSKINNRSTLILVYLGTIIPSIILVNSKVFNLTIFAVSLGAVLAPAMLIKILNLKHNNLSLITCLLLALLTTLSFTLFGWNANILYDIPVGIFLGIIGNFISYRLTANN